MTAQHTHDDQLEPQHQPDGAESGTDPVGPIHLPLRSRLGSRANALVGVVGVAAFGIVMATDGCSTWPTISKP
ncbi:hypothetical protein OHA70_08195 [Kribbella sp. NBC_00382]|uniref:hypothetical protein n=1 Tax=Kribbella sp. NBC_00382 TaxID=2975967 RepID=UPI002E1CCC25